MSHRPANCRTSWELLSEVNSFKHLPSGDIICRSRWLLSSHSTPARGDAAYVRAYMICIQTKTSMCFKMLILLNLEYFNSKSRLYSRDNILLNRWQMSAPLLAMALRKDACFIISGPIIIFKFTFNSAYTQYTLSICK